MKSMKMHKTSLMSAIAAVFLWICAASVQATPITVAEPMNT